MFVKVTLVLAMVAVIASATAVNDGGVVSSVHNSFLLPTSSQASIPASITPGTLPTDTVTPVEMDWSWNTNRIGPFVLHLPA
jgi:hypothetical protein